MEVKVLLAVVGLWGAVSSTSYKGDIQLTNNTLCSFYIFFNILDFG